MGALLILQTTVLDYLSVAGVKPDLVMLMIVFNGFLLGPREGAFLGFAGGVVEDLFSGSYIGLNALSKMAAGCLAGAAGERLYKESAVVAAGVTLFSTFAGMVVNYLLLLYLDVHVSPFYALLRVALPTAAYTAVLAPFLFSRVLRSI
ncbi:MAG: rod shape-determining protein MreD, partial [Peptococcaceae bacterium]|nr:rod shape-determining protein MreD [Peptococcaceae bacterium]